MKKIYTIGHSNHDNIYFLELLKKFNINCVVDIRSVPFSKYVPHFNKDVIKKFLNVHGIYCIYMAKEFGAIREDKNLFHHEGYLDFEKIQATKEFKDGLLRLDAGMEKGYIIALMCTEKDPLDCHRSIMIAPELVKRGFSVLHILPDGNIESQEHLEDRLLDICFPKISQQSLFSEAKENDGMNDLINKAYKQRNSDIAYRTKTLSKPL